MSKVLEQAIFRHVPGAEAVHFNGDHVYVKCGDQVTRYRLSAEAQRIALLEREGRPLDIQPGRVDLLVPVTDDDHD